MADYKVEKLGSPCLSLGEGPHWLPHLRAIMFVDCFNKALNRVFVDTGRYQVLVLDEGGEAPVVSAVIPVQGHDDLYLVALGKNLSLVTWTTSDPDLHVAKPVVLHTTKDDHFNDAKCDPRARLWAGTMGPLDDAGELMEFNNSSLFKIDHDLTCTKWVEKVSISNGLAWSADRKTLYYADSPALTVDAFDYDDEKGEIRNRRVVLDFKKAGLEDQAPDGMTIDTDGNLWVACFGGGHVICVDPTAGKVVREVKIPSKNITSCCWGGDNYDVLYVTSATLKLSKEEIASAPSSGATFAITGLGARGTPAINFKIDPTVLKDKLEGH